MADRGDRPADPARRSLSLMLRAGLAERLRTGWRPAVARGRALLRSAVTTFLVLSLTLWLMPGVQATDVVDTLWLVLLVAAVGALLRPLLLAGVRAVGGLGAMLLGASIQLIVMAVALRLDPADHITGIRATAVAAALAVVFAALLNWFADAGTDASFVAELRRLMTRTRRSRTRRAARTNHTPAAPGPPGRQTGVLIVQLDGVAAPVLDWAVRAGNLPTIGGWLRAGSHALRGWHTGLPSTTPAAQAGILHGVTSRVPAFRWYEKDTGRLIVTRVPRDAAEIERRISDGNGLLRDRGVSISNAFTGDAPTNLLTVSRAGFPGRSARGWAVFMASPFGFTRAIVLGLAEVLTELHQARLQRRRDVQPRVSRLGAFLALRPAAMLLRDVNVSLIAEQMAKGAPVIFCDLVDYDEVAHHAGPARPEALKALENLDHTLGILHRLVAEAARDYHLVVLSDHGQSLGATFRHRHGETLEHLIGRLAGGGNDSRPDAAVIDGPNGSTPAGELTPLVLVSGNLAMVYLTGLPGKLTRAQIDAAHPDLVAGLLAHPGIGLLVVDEDGIGPVAYGRHGHHMLGDGTVVGKDPLAAYGSRARTDLRRHQQIDHVGDLVLISAVDPATDEVAAFEELVGSHGGLGGWQTEAMLIHPAGWRLNNADLDGPDAVHRQLVVWLEHLGLRSLSPTITADQEPDHAPNGAVKATTGPESINVAHPTR